MYGTASGPGTERHQLISRATPGVPGDLQDTFAFGYQMVPADLDADGYTDLLVTGGDDSGNKATRPVGLRLRADRREHPPALRELRVRHGDFNGDGKRDLVVNDVPSDDPDVSGMTIDYGPITRTGKPRVHGQHRH
ncbi:hypothetical protein [Streptomyces sp. KL116D]|uniref:hypothetical protein n=1 Tax=Streptomyces sp. KL116D TaxID=3045152 RepID=UPI003555EA3E